MGSALLPSGRAEEPGRIAAVVKFFHRRKAAFPLSHDIVFSQPRGEDEA